MHGGLLRNGVSPDKISIKKLLNKFDPLFYNNNFNYFGNIMNNLLINQMFNKQDFDYVIDATGACN